MLRLVLLMMLMLTIIPECVLSTNINNHDDDTSSGMDHVAVLEWHRQSPHQRHRAAHCGLATAEACCHAVERAYAVLDETHNSKHTNEHTDDDYTYKQCLAETTRVWARAARTTDDGEKTTLDALENDRWPLFSVWQAEPSVSTGDFFGLVAPTTTTAQSGSPVEWTVFMWNDTAQTGHWIDDETVTNNLPQHLHYLLALGSKAAAAVQPQRKEESWMEEWRISLVSNFDPDERGMHRDMYHTIHVQPPQTTQDDTTETSSTGDLQEVLLVCYIMVHIPSEVFVNEEDFVVRMTNTHPETRKIRVALLPQQQHADGDATTATVVIDQEEPAFVSSPHVRLLRVEYAAQSSGLSLSSSQSSWFDIQFVTEWHMRYPLPFVRDTESSSPERIASSFRGLWIPPPMLLSGEASWSHGARVRVAIQPPPVSSSPHQQTQPMAGLELWVAAGHQGDWELVLGVTLVAAWLGALVMLRDIASVSTWA